jgi:hypothetical protein
LAAPASDGNRGGELQPCRGEAVRKPPILADGWMGIEHAIATYYRARTCSGTTTQMQMLAY